MKNIVALAFALWLTATPLLAHFSWIAPAAPLKVGEVVRVQIGNGHQFPDSEAAMNADNLKVYAVSPSGAKTDLRMEKSANFLAASYRVVEQGLHRFVFVQDRGVMSRTTRGYLPGGKDKHPGAIDSFESFRSAVAYAPAGDGELSKVKLLGLDFELQAEMSNGDVVLTAAKDGRPCAGADIGVVLTEGREQKLGKTGPDGKFTYKVSGNSKLPVLFVANHVEPAPEGASYTRSNHSAALHFHLP